MEEQIVQAVEAGARTMSDLIKAVEGPRSTVLKRAKELAASGRILMAQGEDATWALAPVEKPAAPTEVPAAGSLVGTFQAPALRDGMRRVGARTFKGPTIGDKAEIESRLGFEIPMKGKAMDRNAFLYRLVGEEPRKEVFPLDRLVALFDEIYGGQTECRHREILMYRVIDCVCSPTAYEAPADAPRGSARPKAAKEPRSIKLSAEVSKLLRGAADRYQIEGGAEGLVFDALVGFCAGMGWTDLIRGLVHARNGADEVKVRVQVEAAGPDAPVSAPTAASATP